MYVYVRSVVSSNLVLECLNGAANIKGYSKLLTRPQPCTQYQLLLYTSL